MLVTAVAPVTIVGSPMLSGRRAGRAPNTPASYTSSISGATVRFARLTAMFGRPTPTKQTRWPASSRAAATIIISDFVKSAATGSLMERAPSAVLAVVDRPGRCRGRRPQRCHPIGAKLLDVLAASGDPEDPLRQPGLGGRLVSRDRIPIEIAPVVAVVRALDVGGRRAP